MTTLETTPTVSFWVVKELVCLRHLCHSELRQVGEEGVEYSVQKNPLRSGV